MQQHRRQPWNLKLAAAFFLSIACIVAQDPTSLTTPQVLRVGAKLACRCGGCRNTVGDCPMLRCSYTDPMRARIKGMQDQGKGDSAIVQQIVQEQGIVALSSPPGTGWGLVTWVMPGVALALGFLFYSWYLRRKRSQAVAAPAISEDLLDRYRDQINREFDDDEPAGEGRESGVAKPR